MRALVADRGGFDGAAVLHNGEHAEHGRSGKVNIRDLVIRVVENFLCPQLDQAHSWFEALAGVTSR
jgi:hypothetical protein